MDISGNTVLITGGARGIGYAFAEYFLKTGNKIIICGRREERLLEAKKKHPEFQIKVCDVAKEADRNSLAEWATSNFDTFNIVVNNSGVQRDVDFTKGVSEFLSGENEIRINLEATIVLSGLFIPHLIGKKEASIINISSGLGFIPVARMPVYSASKAGVHAFSMAIRQQLLKSGIKVFEVVPPAIESELNPEVRAKSCNFKIDLMPGEFVDAVMEGIKNNIFEIGYGMTAGLIKASREDLDKSFHQMNSHW